MFEKTLADKFKKIFEFKKVTFDDPSDSKEQNCLFIDVEVPHNKILDGKVIARVTGKATVYAPANELPFGYFAKKIAKALGPDTKDLFFFDVEHNARLYENIVERSFSFVYFFSGQYDPSTGTITTLSIGE